MSSSSYSPNNRDNFELHAKADEWMDVTPKEEILQAEIARLQQAFDKCSTQLDACRLENDLLKGFKTNLEKETLDLKESLQECEMQVQEKIKEWNELQSWSDERMRSYQQTIREQEQKNADLEEQKAALIVKHEQQTQKYLESEHRMQMVISNFDEEKEGLQQSLQETLDDNQLQHNAIAKLSKELEASRAREEALQQHLAKANAILKEQQVQMQSNQKDTRAIATLAQDLKCKKLGLERSLAQTQQALETSKKQEAERTQQLTLLGEEYENFLRNSTSRTTELKTIVKDQTRDLIASKESVRDLQSQLLATNSSLTTLQQDYDELSKHMTHMEAGRHDWLEQKSDLEEKLEEALTELQATRGRLVQLEEHMEEVEMENARLQEHAAAYQEAAEREAALQLQIQEQRQAFEERLEEIRSILGLNFTKMVQTEIKDKLRSVEMPATFRVPLLAQKLV